MFQKLWKGIWLFVLGCLNICNNRLMKYFLKTKLEWNPHASECQVIICYVLRVLKQNSLWQWLRKSLYLLCTHEHGLALGLLKKTKVSLVVFLQKWSPKGLLEIWKSPYQQEAFQKLTNFPNFYKFWIEDARSTGCYT